MRRQLETTDDSQHRFREDVELNPTLGADRINFGDTAGIILAPSVSLHWPGHRRALASG